MQDGFSLEHSTVGIIGLGLMGGSLAMNLKGKCACLIGCDPQPATLELALSKGIIDRAESDPANFHTQVDILILATPVPSILNFLEQLPAIISHPCILMDIGSTKRIISQAMSALPENFDPIGGHPICGKETLGLENADVSLYRNVPFILTPLERTTQRATSAVKEIISTIGATPIEMSPTDHDRILASTSHFPFLLASALAHSTSHDFSPFIGPGFRSTTRLAGTPSHMMLGILQSNRDNVLDAIQTFRNSLDEIESALQDEEYTELEVILNQSRDSHTALTVDGRP